MSSFSAQEITSAPAGYLLRCFIFRSAAGRSEVDGPVEGLDALVERAEIGGQGVGLLLELRDVDRADDLYLGLCVSRDFLARAVEE